MQEKPNPFVNMSTEYVQQALRNLSIEFELKLLQSLVNEHAQLIFIADLELQKSFPMKKLKQADIKYCLLFVQEFCCACYTM